MCNGLVRILFPGDRYHLTLGKIGSLSLSGQRNIQLKSTFIGRRRHILENNILNLYLLAVHSILLRSRELIAGIFPRRTIINKIRLIVKEVWADYLRILSLWRIFLIGKGKVRRCL